MKIIGLTGGIATGKTTASDYLAHLGTPIIDADVINKHLLEPQQAAYLDILKAFPNIPLLDNKALDKKYLRQLIFNDNAQKKRLEALLHPLISLEIKQQIRALKKNRQPPPYCIVSVPLLIEANFQSLVDEIWVTDCSKKRQIERLMQRDHITNEDAELILTHQLSSKERNAYAQQIIFSEDLVLMQQKLKQLHQQQILLNS